MKYLLVLFISLQSIAAVKSLKNSSYMLGADAVTNSEVKETEFGALARDIHKLYYPRAKKEGKEIVLFLDWSTPYFSAWATHPDDKYQINFWGGFARIPGMLTETWEFVVCHEIGHILGGKPRIDIKDSRWASAEGQSDHFAVNKCLPFYYKTYNKTDFDSRKSLPFELSNCLEAYEQNIEQNICMKILRAGRGFIDVLGYLSLDTHNADYRTPAPPTIELLNKGYPSSQCRLDIFVQGSLCLKRECERSSCWYKK